MIGMRDKSVVRTLGLFSGIIFVKENFREGGIHNEPVSISVAGECFGNSLGFGIHIARIQGITHHE